MSDQVCGPDWRLFPLSGLGSTESGIGGRVFGVIAIIAALVSGASGLAIAISGE